MNDVSSKRITAQLPPEQVKFLDDQMSQGLSYSFLLRLAVKNLMANYEKLLNLKYLMKEDTTHE